MIKNIRFDKYLIVYNINFDFKVLQHTFFFKKLNKIQNLAVIIYDIYHRST